jgi:hypothetical protein
MKKNKFGLFKTIGELLLVLIILVLLLAANSKAAQYTLVNGNLYTSFNASVGAGVNTNTSGVLTNNVQTGVNLASTTNYFTLSTGIGTQVATNLWPSQSFPVASGYPGTVYGPYRTFQNTLAVGSTATNSAGNVTFTRRYAGYDGVLWVSNVFVMNVTVPANSTYGISTSNFQSSFQYVAVQQDEWPVSTSAATNEVNSTSSGAGL